MPAEDKIKYYEVRSKPVTGTIEEWLTSFKTSKKKEAREELRRLDELWGHDTYHRVVKVTEEVIEEY